MNEFNRDTMVEWLLDWADSGSTLLPLHPVKDGICMCGIPDCQNQFKHPRFSHWQSSPLREVSEIEGLVEAGVFSESYGIVLGDDDLVVDFDPRNGEDAISNLNKALNINIDDECSFIVDTGSGGRHYFFKKDPSIKIQKNVRELAGIDFLSKGNFVIGCGSNHISGNPYSAPFAAKSDVRVIADAPQVLIDLVKKKESTYRSDLVVGQRIEADVLELQDALSHIPNTDSTDYDFWLSIGMALHYETQGSREGYDLWYEWSDKGNKHDGTVMERKWASFKDTGESIYTAGTIFKYAADNGWERSFHQDIDMSFIFDRIRNGDVTKYEVKHKSDEGVTLELSEAPDDFAKLPGVIGEIVDYNLRTAHYPLFMPALNSAITLCSMVVGRDYTTDYDNYSGIYTISIAETGAGKEHSAKVVKRILEQAGKPELAKAEVTGKSAIISELYDNPRCVFLKDEMAHWIQVASNKNASENKIMEMKSWMEVFTKQDTQFASDSFTNLSEILKGKKDEKGLTHVSIKKPSVSLMGMTTPQKFAESITSSLISDGFLNRFIVFFAQEGDQKMNKQATNRPVPASILSWIETIDRRVLHENKGSGISRDQFDETLNPVVIPFSFLASDALDKYEDKILARKAQLRKESLELMISRNREKVMKLALVVELAKDPYAKEIALDSVNFAIAVIDFTFEELVKYLRFQVTTGGIDKKYREALELIGQNGAEGISKTEMMKRPPFRSCKPQEQTEILKYLVGMTEEVAMIEESSESGKGRKKQKFYLKKYVKEVD